MNKNKEKINKVVESGLCTSCGTCAGICPNGACYMELGKKTGIYIPQINDDRCTGCNLCTNACPVLPNENDSLSSWLSSSTKPTTAHETLEVSDSFIGHSANKLTRYNGASGGIISELLVNLIQKDIINKAIITDMNENNPLIPRPEIVTTKTEILEASGSKYFPVALNTILDEILHEKVNDKYAYVGLPCHLAGIKKAEYLRPNLQEKIILHIGIMCGHVPNSFATQYIINQFGYSSEDLKNIRYRGKGWPGKLHMDFNNGDSVSIPYGDTKAMGCILSSLAFTPKCCYYCPDALAEQADISVGDAWNIYPNKDNNGKSLILAWNNSGEKVLNNFEKSGNLVLEHITKNRVKKSQHRIINAKHKELPARLMIFRQMNKKNFISFIPIIKRKDIPLKSLLKALILVPILEILDRLSLRKKVTKLPLLFFRIIKGLNLLKH